MSTVESNGDVVTLTSAQPAGVRRAWWRAGGFSLYVGVGIVSLYALSALLAPWIAPHPPDHQDLLQALAKPSSQHWLGTDALGRDQFSRLVYAARVDLPVAFGALVVPFAIGTLIGSIAGYLGGIADAVLMRIADAVQAFPIYILLLVLVFAFGQGAFSFILASSLVSWVAYARLIRGEILRAKQLPYVMAAVTTGLPHWRIVGRHVIPNTIGRSVVYAMSDFILLILALASLSYLGVGIPAPTAEWGRMIAESQIYLRSQWWLLVAPGLAIVVLGAGLSLLADAWEERGRR